MAQDLSSVALGRNASINRNTGAAFGTVTWVAVPNVQDVTLTSSRAKGDVSCRGTEFKQYVMGQRDVSVSFTVVFVRGETAYGLFLAAHVAGTPIQLAILDGPATLSGAYGINADWEVPVFNRKEMLDDGIKVDIELCLAKTTNAPAAITISA